MEACNCKTRYPILLIHGTGFRDLGYWGRIPKALRERGAQVYFGGQDSWATVEENGAALKRRVEELLTETGSEKLHLIAHSKGGLEARYLISTLGMAPHVASLSLISTPNHGSRTMDFISRLPSPIMCLIGFFVNSWYRLLGDKHPNFQSTCRQFTTAWAEEFNRQNPDADGVLYRSYAGSMQSCLSDVCMWFPNLVIGLAEGENDGLVTVESAAWSGFCGPWRGVGGRGVSHLDEVDFRRRPLKRRGEVWDVVEEYVHMVEELREMGL